MAWFEVRGGNHVKPTFFQLSDRPFLASRLKGKRHSKGPTSSPVSQLNSRWAGAVEKRVASCLPAFLAHVLTSSPASGSLSPRPSQTVLLFRFWTLSRQKLMVILICLTSRSALLAATQPHKLSGLHPLLVVAWGSGQMVTFLGWWIGSFLPSLSQDMDFMRLSCDRLKPLWIKQNLALVRRSNPLKQLILSWWATFG